MVRTSEASSALERAGLGFGLETHYVLKSDLAGRRRPDVGETPYV
jgi:hypothetical protein